MRMPVKLPGPTVTPITSSAEAGNPGVDPGAGLSADPARLAAIAVFAGLCVTLAVLGFRVHALRSANRCLEARVEELCDENWELSDAEEHAKSVVEAQGDLIVRRAPDGSITYANDAFCALAGQPRDALRGARMVHLRQYRVRFGRGQCARTSGYPHGRHRSTHRHAGTNAVGSSNARVMTDETVIEWLDL